MAQQFTSSGQDQSSQQQQQQQQQSSPVNFQVLLPPNLAPSVAAFGMGAGFAEDLRVVPIDPRQYKQQQQQQRQLQQPPPPPVITVSDGQWQTSRFEDNLSLATATLLQPQLQPPLPPQQLLQLPQLDQEYGAVRFSGSS